MFYSIPWQLSVHIEEVAILEGGPLLGLAYCELLCSRLKQLHASHAECKHTENVKKQTTKKISLYHSYELKYILDVF